VWGQRPGQPVWITNLKGKDNTCTKTRHWYAGTAAANSFSLPASRSFMRRKRDIFYFVKFCKNIEIPTGKSLKNYHIKGIDGKNRVC
jgi:hypothetical protein